MKKNSTFILVVILLFDLVFRLSSISTASNRLLDLLYDNIISGNIFDAHILSHRSSYFWFNLILCLIPHIIILLTLIGVYQFFKSGKTVINKYLIGALILGYFPTLPMLIIQLLDLTKFSSKEFFSYDSIWSLSILIFHYAAFIYITIYFSFYHKFPEGNEDVSVNRKIRFKNYLADTIYCLYQSVLYHELLKNSSENNFVLIFIFLSILYYICCESLFHQSLGKLLTNSIIVFNGNSLTGSIIRTFARKIPFEPFSFFLNGSFARWHDKLSNSKIARL